MTPAAHLLTWPTGNQTAVPGPKAPCYRGVTVDPLFKDPGLFERDQALVDLLRRVAQDSSYQALDRTLQNDILASIK